jgi:hypothetical protein
MIWYVPTLPFNQQRTLSLHAAISLHPPHFPKHPRLQLRVHYPIKTACMRRCAVPKVHRQLHGDYRVCDDTHLGSPHIKSTFPASPHAMQSRSQLREDEKRQKGLGKACCETPVDLMAGGDAAGADAATPLNALNDCNVVDFFSFSPRAAHTSTPLHIVSVDRSVNRRNLPRGWNHKLTFSRSGFCKILPPSTQERTLNRRT